MKSNILTKNFSSYIFLLTSVYASSLIIYLTYDVMLAPDFTKYITYFDYYSGLQDGTNLEQGNLFFYLHYAFFIFISSISNLSNETVINLSVNLTNSLVFFTGMIGLYKYFYEKRFNKGNILIVLSALCFFPVTWKLRLTLKPELFAFLLLSWILYFINSDKKNSNLLKASILAALLVNTKSSIAVMGVLFIFFELIFTNRQIIRKKNIFYLLVFCILSGILLVDNYVRNDIFISNVVHEEKYNNKADVEFFTTIHPELFRNNPGKIFHNDSFFGIILYDTFTDYFGNYWNSEYSELNLERKEFLIFTDLKNKEKIPSINYSKDLRTFYIKASFEKFDIKDATINNLRKYYSLIASVIFFILTLFFSIYKPKYRVVLLSPFIGIVILAISSLGVFGNNFDPIEGDSVKSFYYGFYLLISFPTLLLLIIDKFKLPKKALTSLLIIFFLFQFGFPHSYGTINQNAIQSKNAVLPLCEFNFLTIDKVFGFDTKMDCSPEIINKYKYLTDLPQTNYQFVSNRIPYFSFLLLLLSFTGSRRIFAKIEKRRV